MATLIQIRKKKVSGLKKGGCFFFLKALQKKEEKASVLTQESQSLVLRRGYLPLGGGKKERRGVHRSGKEVA